MDKSKELIVIAGPTASGKTKRAIEMAEQLQCDIFSADSRQIYKELNIGVAKPNAEELDRVKHHFINHISIHEEYNAGRYELEMDKALGDYFQLHDKAILVGGTGLYITAVLEGLDDFPAVDKAIKIDLETDWLNGKQEKMLEELKANDLETYLSIDKENSRRVIRALSVMRSSGKKFSAFKSSATKQHDYNITKIYIDLPREQLYERINQRVDNMMKEGLLEEVKSLLPYQHIQALQTVGYTELFHYFNGIYTLNEAVDKIKQHSRNYAKRQVTWFNKYYK